MGFIQDVQTGLSKFFFGGERASYNLESTNVNNLTYGQDLARKKLDMLNDNFEDYVRWELANQFSAKNYNRMKNLVSTELNLFGRIVNMLSKSYAYNPLRRASNNQTYDEVYQEIIDESNINRIMPVVDKIVHATNACAVHVAWRDGIRFDIITVDRCNYELDAEGNIIYIKYEVAPLDIDNPGDRRYMEWGVDIDGVGYISHYKNDEEIETEINPYVDEDGIPIIPFALFTKSENITNLPGDFSSGYDLYKATLQICVLCTYLNYLMKMQSYKQPIFMGKLEKQISTDWDAASMIEVRGDGVTATTLDLQSNYNQIWDTIKSRAENLATIYGISAEAFKATGTPSSGYALKLQNRSLDEHIELMRRQYEFCETRLFDIVRIVNNFNNAKKIDIMATFNMQWVDNTYDESPNDTINAWISKIKNNVKTYIDWIQDENPNLTREEAEKLYAENKKVNEQYKSLSDMLSASIAQTKQVDKSQLNIQQEENVNQQA